MAARPALLPLPALQHTCFLSLCGFFLLCALSHILILPRRRHLPAAGAEQKRYRLPVLLALLLSVSWALLLLSSLPSLLLEPACCQHSPYQHNIAYATGQLVTWLLALWVLLLHGKQRGEGLVFSARVWLVVNSVAALLLSACVVLRLGFPQYLKAAAGDIESAGAVSGAEGTAGTVEAASAAADGLFSSTGAFGAWCDLLTLVTLPVALLFGAIGWNGRPEWAMQTQPPGLNPRDVLRTPLLNNNGATREGTAKAEKHQKQQQQPPPMTLYASANWLSAVTFGWVLPLLEAGSEKPVRAAAVPILRECDRSEANYRAFSASWTHQIARAKAAERRNHEKRPGHLKTMEGQPQQQVGQAQQQEGQTQQQEGQTQQQEGQTQQQAPRASVARTLWECFWRSLLFTGLLVLGRTAVMYGGPLLLNRFVLFATREGGGGGEGGKGERVVSGEGVLLVLALLLCKGAEVLLGHHFSFKAQVLGLEMKAALVGALYRKGLRLSSKAKQRHTLGEIVNYMSTDAQRIADLMLKLHSIWVLPLQIVCALFILFHAVGLSMLAGLGVMLAVLVANLAMGPTFDHLDASILAAKDARLQATSDALCSMRTLKLYAWQHHFQNQIQSLRDREAGWIAWYLAYAAVNIFFLWLTPLAVSVATFSAMIALGVPLTPGSTFTAIATFRIVQEPLSAFPDVVSAVSQAGVSLQRLSRFLLEEELEADTVEWSAVEWVRSGGIGEERGEDERGEGRKAKGKDRTGGCEDGRVEEGQETETGKISERIVFETVEELEQEQQNVIMSGQGREEQEPLEGQKREEGEVVVRIQNASFSWEADASKPTLTAVDLVVRRGMRVAVCGAVGSGKSSLLSCILGEIPKLQGKVFVTGPTAYVPQSPWVQNATIRENILFGQPWDDARYRAALEQSALIADLRVLPRGDNTLIGERGVNLSGGQKQRVQLARAMYAGVGNGAEVFLLDDPFSAVDAHTGSQLFLEYVLKGLAGRTIILVTHQLEFLPAADLILVMKEGRIVQAGRYEELLAQGTEFSALVEAHTDALHSVATAAAAAEPATEPNLRESADPAVRRSVERECEGVTAESTGEDVREAEAVHATAATAAGGPVGGLGGSSSEDGDGQLINEEERASGRVSLPVYWHYITKVLGGWHVPLLVVVQLAWQALQIGSDRWLAAYTSEGTEYMSAGTEYTSARAEYTPAETEYCSAESGYTSAASAVTPAAFIKLYSLLALGSSMFVLLRTSLVLSVGWMTSQAFFKSMLHAVFRAPMSFFDSTPIGRIISRASEDQGSLDLNLPFKFGTLLAMFFQMLGILFVASTITWPVLYAVIPLAYLFFSYQDYFLATSRELSRLDGVTRAPIIEHFSETLSGAAVIRAFGQEARFAQRSGERVDSNGRVAFHLAACTAWLGVHLELLGALLLCFSALMLLCLPPSNLSPGLAGMSLSYCLALSEGLFFLTRAWCRIENQMVSAERLLLFSHPTVPSEAPLLIPSHRPPPSWPHLGCLTFESVQVRYRPDLPLVLKDVSLRIGGGEKVGVVGRTGSGKSTLVAALFRLVEPTAGRVVIDGVDTSTIGLADLRSRLGIIPQDPTLFRGSVRSNLDPSGEYGDEEVWDALEGCQLGEVVRGLEEQLQAQVVEGGANWSVGQRQLFFLGRALLKRTRILVLDEATASVDASTDAAIQRTIKESFGDATIISIAHRITTVINSDKVVVMDKGTVAEFDEPAVLLEDKASMFSRLVSEYSARPSEMAEVARSLSIENLVEVADSR